ncbi:class I SAM-dependent methyltransferase [Sphaerisporangium aureirubrum]|uniref:Class I SAM-dependent methyltransferase n=1 Tax=Sphaerisporangium aureirubrum TaxID=1544736 RepID=A0ABW1NAL1_9ACTN
MRTPPPRLLLAASAAAAGLAVLALVPLSASGLVDPLQATQLALSAVTLAIAAALIANVRRTDGKALRIDARTKRQEAALAQTGSDLRRIATTLDDLAGRLDDAGRDRVRHVLAALGEDRMELTAQSGRLAGLDEAVTRLNDATRETTTGLADLRRAHDRLATATGVQDLADRLTDLAGTVRDTRSAVTGTARQTYTQLEALVDLRALLQPRAPLPPLRGWAASPDVLRLLVGRIATARPKTILECGSGASTIWLAYAAQRFGGGHVIALEHDERFAQSTRDLILAHNLQDVAEVRHAPLTTWTDRGGETFPWYDVRAVQDLPEVGLVFVDGPPGATGPEARYPAVPLLLPHCASDAWIVLDDADRPAEREIAERWLAEYPELAATSHKAEKGAIILRRTHG